MHEVKNYDVNGETFKPNVLSNKVILTPPAPGNVRSSMWSKKSLWAPTWASTLEFRATGPERGAGRLQLWLAKDGATSIGTSSIYSVGKFEGLALVVDTLGGSAGMIRGFLNDGTKEYKNHQAVDSLAFGHCTYAYRNLGRASIINVRQDKNNFRVEVDGNLCFETNAIRIPFGYKWGITANSAETPDSFEVFKLYAATGAAQNQQQQQAPPVVNGRSDQKPAPQRVNPNTNYLAHDQIPNSQDIPEVAAAAIEQSKQFADLHYRLQAMTKALSAFQGDFKQFQAHAQEKDAKLLELLNGLTNNQGGRPFPHNQITAIDQRQQALERAVQEIARDQRSHQQKLQPQIDGIRRIINEGHSSVLRGVQDNIGGLASSVPKLGVIVAAVFGSQAFLVAAYLWYKRRKAMGPKKYL